MKKIIIVLIAMTLVFSLYSLSVSATSENTPTTDNEAEIGSNTVVEGDNTEAEGVTADEILEIVTDSTLWATVGTVVASVLTIVIVVTNKFKGIASLIGNKADALSVANAIRDSKNEVKTACKDEIAKVNKALEESREVNERLLTIVVLFVTQSRINPTAKAEILNLITGVKKFDGNPEEVIAKVTTVIEEAKKSEEKVETPALDVITTMELG